MGSMGMPVGHLSAKHLRCRTSHFGGLLENSVAVVRNSGRPAARAARPVATPSPGAAIRRAVHCGKERSPALGAFGGFGGGATPATHSVRDPLNQFVRAPAVPGTSAREGGYWVA